MEKKSWESRPEYRKKNGLSYGYKTNISVYEWAKVSKGRLFYQGEKGAGLRVTF